MATSVAKIADFPAFHAKIVPRCANSLLDASAQKYYLLGTAETEWGSNQDPVAEVIIAREIFERLRQATAADPAVLAELCREYVVEARSTIVRLRKALTQRDAVEVRERAHYLKGSSLMIGARILAQCCTTLEQMGRDSELEAAEPVLEQAITALKAVEDELARELGSVALPAEGSAA